MISNIDKKLILKYMEQNYHVSRIKINNRFKRGVILDNGDVFLLGDKQSYQQIKPIIIKNLSEVFHVKGDDLIQIVDNFFS